MINYYLLLGVDLDASSEEIRLAYKKLAVKLHPDKNNSDPFFSERFKEISAAYEILIDEETRTEYTNALIQYHQLATGNDSIFQELEEEKKKLDTEKKSLRQEFERKFVQKISQCNKEHQAAIEKLKHEYEIKLAEMKTMKEGSQCDSEVLDELIINNIESCDLQKLIRANNYPERIRKETNQKSTHTTPNTSNHIRHKWFKVTVIVVISLFVFVMAYFAVRAYQYRKLVDHAKTLQKDLDEYDRRIAAYKDNPKANIEELQRLIAEIEATQQKHNRLKDRFE